MAGVRVPQAQARPLDARELLDEATAIYEEVAERGRRIFRCVSAAQIAVCIQGKALASYYRALLVAESPEARSTELRDATRFALDALEQWQVIEAEEDSAECVKAAKIVAKIGLGRWSTGSCA